MSSYPYEDEEEGEEEEQEVLKDFQTVEDNLMILIDARPAMLIKNEEGKVRAEGGGEGRAREGGGGWLGGHSQAFANEVLLPMTRVGMREGCSWLYGICTPCLLFDPLDSASSSVPPTTLSPFPLLPPYRPR